MNIPSEHLLILAACLFALGVLGFLIRRNVIIVLASVELVLNAVNLTLVAGSRMHSTADHLSLGGPIFAMFVIFVAAAEAAIGLALVIALFRLKQAVGVDAFADMKG